MSPWHSVLALALAVACGGPTESNKAEGGGGGGASDAGGMTSSGGTYPVGGSSGTGASGSGGIGGSGGVGGSDCPEPCVPGASCTGWTWCYRDGALYDPMTCGSDGKWQSSFDECCNSDPGTPCTTEGKLCGTIAPS